MPTIIDSLLVTLDIKADGFKSGAEESNNALEQLQANAGLTADSVRRLSQGIQSSQNDLTNNSSRTAREMTQHGQSASGFFSKIRNEALMMLGVFTAGAGLAAFAKNTINAASSTGILAQQIGMNVNKLNAMEAAAQRAGSAEGAMTQQLKQEAEKRARVLAGESVTQVYGQKFLQAGGNFQNMETAEGQLKEYSDMYARVRKTAMEKGGKSEAEASAYAATFLKDAGLNEQLLPLITQGTAAMNDQIAAQEKKVAMTDADAKAALKAKQAWFDFTQQLEQTGQRIVLSLTPALERLTTWLGKVKLPPPAEMGATIDAWIAKIEPFFKTVDDGVGKVNHFAESVGGWANILKALIGLKIAAWTADLLALTAGLVGFSGAASTAGGAASAAKMGLGGLGSGLAIGAAGLAGWGVGSKAYESSSIDTQQKIQDTVGKGIAKVAGWFGNEDAKQAVATDENYQKTSGGLDKGLGYISSRYEGNIGSAHKDNIGWAYGKFQFNTGGGLPQFLKDNPKYAQELLSAGAPGTEGFNSKWREIAKRDPEGFEAAQMATGKKKYFDPAMATAQSLGFDTSNRGIQEAMFSGAVQHGAWNTKVLPRIAKKYNLQSMSAAEQLKAIYAERRKYASENLSGDVLKGVLGRYSQEEANTIELARFKDKKLNRPEISIANDNAKTPPPIIIGRGEKDAAGRLKNEPMIKAAAGDVAGYSPKLPSSMMVSSGMQTLNPTQNNNFTINVKSTDPKGAANEIKTTLNEKLTSNFMSGMH